MLIISNKKEVEKGKTEEQDREERESTWDNTRNNSEGEQNIKQNKVILKTTFPPC
jgi:hypothetical protein